MLESQTLSVAIPRDWQIVYERIWHPEYFPQWASGLSSSDLHRDGAGWVASGPSGTVRLRFSEHNGFGVMDHWVELGDGQVVYVPMRVIANGADTLVQLTLFRQPGMTAEKFEQDAEWVRKDLARLLELSAEF